MINFMVSKGLEEMNKLQVEIDRLRACEQHLDYTLKCAETRHENRNNRFIGELARDCAHEGLIEEIMKLRQNLRDVRQKIEDTMYFISLCLDCI